MFALTPGGTPRRPGATQRSSAGSGSSQVISPVVVATRATHGAAPGTDRLVLVVLWRRQPGWFASGTQSSSSNGGASGFSATATYGRVSVSVELDSATLVATVQGTRVELGNDNVILVDDVDMASGPRVVRTLHVDAGRLERRGEVPIIQSVLRPYPDVVQFLRCDAKMPDGRGQAMMGLLCAQLNGR